MQIRKNTGQRAEASGMRLLKSIALLVVLASLTGCPLFGFLASTIPQYESAVFDLPNRPTLVLVDDPRSIFGGAQALATIAAYTGADLLHSGTVTTVIDQRNVAELAGKAGDRFAEMSVEQVGKALGAAQVIHVTIRSADMAMAPGVLRPTAVVEVVVVDVENRQRMFPPASESSGVPSTPGTRGGHMVAVTLRARTTNLDNQRALDVIRQRLAERVGVRIGELFHRHQVQEDEQMRP
jgi:hypothetical protein